MSYELTIKEKETHLTLKSFKRLVTLEEFKRGMKCIKLNYPTWMVDVNDRDILIVWFYGCREFSSLEWQNLINGYVNTKQYPPRSLNELKLELTTENEIIKGLFKILSDAEIDLIYKEKLESFERQKQNYIDMLKRGQYVPSNVMRKYNITFDERKSKGNKQIASAFKNDYLR